MRVVGTDVRDGQRVPADRRHHRIVRLHLLVRHLLLRRRRLHPAQRARDEGEEFGGDSAASESVGNYVKHRHTERGDGRAQALISHRINALRFHIYLKFK